MGLKYRSLVVVVDLGDVEKFAPGNQPPPPLLLPNILIHKNSVFRLFNKSARIPLCIWSTFWECRRFLEMKATILVDFSYLLFNISRFGITDLRVLRRYLWQFGLDLQTQDGAPRHQLVGTKNCSAAPLIASWCHKFLASKETWGETWVGLIWAGGFSRRVGAHVREFSLASNISAVKSLFKATRCV